MSFIDDSKMTFQIEQLDCPERHWRNWMQKQRDWMKKWRQREKKRTKMRISTWTTMTMIVNAPLFPLSGWSYDSPIEIKYGNESWKFKAVCMWWNISLLRFIIWHRVFLYHLSKLTNFKVRGCGEVCWLYKLMFSGKLQGAKHDRDVKITPNSLFQ